MDEFQEVVVNRLMALSDIEFKHYQPLIEVIAGSLALTGDDVAEYVAKGERPMTQQELASMVRSLPYDKFVKYQNLFKGIRPLNK